MTTEDQKTMDTLLELKQLLQTENEHLYQQYNHLMIRNQKLMKRIDDQQQLNDRLQGRIAALENIIDKLRLHNYTSQVAVFNTPHPHSDSTTEHEYIKDSVVPGVQGLKSNIDMTGLVSHWSSLAGQFVRNAPTKKRQMQILSLLYENQKMSGMKLFIACGITGVSGARYISALKQFGLIEFSGFRKDGFYFITEKGKKLIEAEPVS